MASCLVSLIGRWSIRGDGHTSVNVRTSVSTMVNRTFSNGKNRNYHHSSHHQEKQVRGYLRPDLQVAGFHRRRSLHSTCTEPAITVYPWSSHHRRCNVTPVEIHQPSQQTDRQTTSYKNCGLHEFFPRLQSLLYQRKPQVSLYSY